MRTLALIVYLTVIGIAGCQPRADVPAEPDLGERLTIERRSVLTDYEFTLPDFIDQRCRELCKAAKVCKPIPLYNGCTGKLESVLVYQDEAKQDAEAPVPVLRERWLMVVPFPGGWSDCEALAIIGHEVMHTLGARHDHSKPGLGCSPTTR